MKCAEFSGIHQNDYERKYFLKNGKAHNLGSSPRNFRSRDICVTVTSVLNTGSYGDSKKSNFSRLTKGCFNAQC